MRVFLTTAMTALVMLLGQNQYGLAATTDSQAESIAQVIDASKLIVSAFGADDPDTYFKLFVPEATFIFYNAPLRLQSRAAYQQEWASWRREIGFRVRSCNSSEQRVQIFGDIAILTHLVHTEITTNLGDEVLNERETIVFHRRNERWLAVHEHLSPRPKDTE